MGTQKNERLVQISNYFYEIKQNWYSLHLKFLLWRGREKVATFLQTSYSQKSIKLSYGSEHFHKWVLQVYKVVLKNLPLPMFF